MEHKQRIQDWARLGTDLGYLTTTEFKLPSSHDRVDCIWKKDTEFIAIEVECGKFGNQQFKNLIKVLSLKERSVPARLIFDCELEATQQKLLGLVKRFEHLFIQNNCRVFVLNRQTAIFELVKSMQLSKIPTACNNYYTLANLEKFRCLIEDFESRKQSGIYDFKIKYESLEAYRLFVWDMLCYLKGVGYLDLEGEPESKHIKIHLKKEFKDGLMGIPIPSVLHCDYKDAKLIWGTS